MDYYNGDRKDFMFTSQTLPLASRLYDSIVIFGAGGCGRELKRNWETIGGTVAHFVDNNANLWGSTVESVSVISAKDAVASGLPIFIASYASPAIYQQLVAQGCDPVEIYIGDPEYKLVRDGARVIEEQKAELDALMDAFGNDESRFAFAQGFKYYERWLTSSQHLLYPQYAHPLVKAEDGDIILNCGGYDGDTDLLYHSMADNCEVHTFEPFEEMLPKLRQVAAGITNGKSIIVNKCVWNKNETITLQVTETASRILNPGGKDFISPTRSVEAVTIDHYCEENGVVPTMIKMDVEAAEPQAIEGAENVLRKYRPKLQISIYHTPEQRVSIPLQLRKIDPNYRYYIGHHTPSYCETILYGLPV
ncbi:FkbM family methyltransferase [uncultured Pseudodesulfovibrio sp.]|uniref:FkbM family methyltransferase n=1 Tax=uncultured Pseudodesulfovibrio sp. TaxID=2035858 RepID=UPI0029C71BAA|nr:FkbM family methyltransferase [uncultured Pseudodesulfovibrio sp.]